MEGDVYAGSQRNIDTYPISLCREYHSDLIDASTWLNDFDTFDGHHMLPGGTEKFTLRLSNDVVEARLQAESTPWPYQPP